MGHGLLLAKFELAINLGKKAFSEAATYTDNDGVEHAPVCAPQVADTRAVYTTSVDKWAGELCSNAAPGTPWEYLQLKLGLPNLDGIQVMKTLSPSNDTERVVLVLHLQYDWESRVDQLEKNQKNEFVLRLGFGAVGLRKRRDGARPAGAAPPPPPPPPPAAPPTSRPTTPAPGAATAKSAATGRAKNSMEI